MDTLISQLEQSSKAAKSETPKPVQPVAEAPAKRSKLGFILGGALLVAAGVGGYFYVSGIGTVSTDDAQVDAHIAPIAPKVGGNIVEILAKDNQAVRAGDVLVRIDARDYEARVAQARAALAAAESQAVGARAGVPLTQATTNSGVSGAEAQLAAANADHTRAAADYDRASSSESPSLVPMSRPSGQRRIGRRRI